MKKAIIAFTMVFLLMSLSLIPVVSAHQQKESAKQTDKTKVIISYNRIKTTLISGINTNSTLVKILVAIFLIWYNLRIAFPVIFLVIAGYIFHCFIWNPLKVLFEVWYLRRHPEVEPW